MCHQPRDSAAVKSCCWGLMGTPSEGPRVVKKKAGLGRWSRGQKQQKSLAERRGTTLLMGRQQLLEKLSLKLLVKLQPQQESADGGSQSGGEVLHLSAPGHQGEGHSPEKARAARPTDHTPEQAQLLVWQMKRPPALHLCNTR